MDYSVKILADSIGPHEVRLTTFELRYPRAAVHEDFLTHRDFSRNASSSRAMPVAKMIERADWCPEVFGKNKRGMGTDEVLDREEQICARIGWEEARSNAVASAEYLMALGVAKEDANLLLRPFEWIDVVVSATRWRNFLSQRSAEATGKVRRQMKRIADGMQDLLMSESPVYREPGRWHLPYVRPEEFGRSASLEVAGFGRAIAHASAMRCARVSYARHDGKSTNWNDDAEDCQVKLVTPRHWSPLEHPAVCVDPDAPIGVAGLTPLKMFGGSNFDPGWVQLRKHYAQECVVG